MAAAGGCSHALNTPQPPRKRHRQEAQAVKNVVRMTSTNEATVDRCVAAIDWRSQDIAGWAGLLHMVSERPTGSGTPPDERAGDREHS
jgi:hypothetical protein